VRLRARAIAILADLHRRLQYVRVEPLHDLVAPAFVVKIELPAVSPFTEDRLQIAFLDQVLAVVAGLVPHIQHISISRSAMTTP
jgi:hypothetical protein